tara:strand:+ start:7738 stop:8418 length:681 start_codon:yes stop_codon:yes gene_type:complete
MILKAKKIKKTYISGSVRNPVLMDLNFELNDGEIVAIGGASGSGKSTLLNVLGLLDSPDSGDIAINDKPILSIHDIESERAKSIGFLFQFHHLLTEFTVLENLLIPLMLDRYTSEISNLSWCNELLSSLSLSHIKNRFPSELSGGERQRIAFLRSLVNRPKFILADEPTGNLDNSNTEILLELIKSFRDKYNIAFIIATHDENVTKICNRILNLKNGKLHLIKGAI